MWLANIDQNELVSAVELSFDFRRIDVSGGYYRLGRTFLVGIPQNSW